MPLYISYFEQLQSKKETGCASLLLKSPYLHLLHSTELENFELGPYNGLLLDFFELTNFSTNSLPYVFLPSGGPILIFTLYSKPSICYLCGPLTSARKIEIPAKGVLFCVRLKVGGMGYFVKQSTTTLVNQAVPLIKFLAGTEYLQSHLRNICTFQNRCRFFLDYLNRIGGEEYHIDPLVQKCIDLIYESHGRDRVYDLTATFHQSGGYLRRIFRETTGMSLKIFSEIVQFKYSLSSILIDCPRVLIDVAKTHGYYDLPHMSRTYREFLNCTASGVRYLNIEELDVSNIVPNNMTERSNPSDM